MDGTHRLSPEAFCARVADILETDGVTLETDFRALPGWCSLQAFGLLVFLENDCGVRMDIPAFRRLSRVGELYRAAAEA